MLVLLLALLMVLQLSMQRGKTNRQQVPH